MPANKNQNFISLKEAAAILDYAPDYVGWLIRKRRISGRKILSKKIWKISRQTILNYLLGGRLAAGARHLRLMTDEILQNMAGGVIALNRDGDIVYINAAARSLLGLTNIRPEPMTRACDVLSAGVDERRQQDPGG